MSQPRIALVTARAARDLDEDLPPLVDALTRAGAVVSVLDWDDDTADWAAQDLAVLRSTWDYTQRLAEFLAWIDRAAVQTTLLNPPDTVRWNVDKHYLGELANQGVATVPGAFVEPGDDAAAALADFLAAYAGADAFEFVVKPCVEQALQQPYLARVDEHGETALLWFNGEFSHAIRKGPLLRRNEDATRALFAPEHITARVPSLAEMALARETLARIPAANALLYARVDVIHDDAGSPRLLELELSEPSLFFGHAEGSADRFAAAILARVQAVRTTEPAVPATAR